MDDITKTSLYIPDNLLKKTKIKCVKSGEKVNEYILRLIREDISGRKPDLKKVVNE